MAPKQNTSDALEILRAEMKRDPKLRAEVEAEREKLLASLETLTEKQLKEIEGRDIPDKVKIPAGKQDASKIAIELLTANNDRRHLIATIRDLQRHLKHDRARIRDLELSPEPEKPTGAGLYIIRSGNAYLLKMSKDGPQMTMDATKATLYRRSEAQEMVVKIRGFSYEAEVLAPPKPKEDQD